MEKNRWFWWVIRCISFGKEVYLFHHFSKFCEKFSKIHRGHEFCLYKRFLGKSGAYRAPCILIIHMIIHVIHMIFYSLFLLFAFFVDFENKRYKRQGCILFNPLKGDGLLVNGTNSLFYNFLSFSVWTRIWGKVRNKSKAALSFYKRKLLPEARLQEFYIT